MLSTARCALELCAEFPLFVTPFPQQKITRTTSIRVGGEYYWFQRKSDLPEGESGLAAVSENRQRDSVRATGKRTPVGKALAANVIIEE
jgi:hypothetical protein